MAINTYMPSINNFLKGFQDGLPGMKDYQHASRLYIDDNFKLMPKQKFLFYVKFDTDESLFVNGFNQNERYQLGYLVKACDLPKYNMSYEEKTQYNKKMYNATRIAYEPVNITFHDDHADTVNAFWKKYYEYNIADSVNMNDQLVISNTKDDYYEFGDERKITKFGLDTPKQKRKPYLKKIDIFVLHKKRFTSMSLINPVIGSFSHDNVDQGDGAGMMENTMQILYETVVYSAGIVNKNDVPGFATLNYDNSPSPLSVLGGGTTSIFGPGGIVDGIGSVMKNLNKRNPNYLGAILAASNTYNNAKKIKKSDAKAELKGIAKEGILAVGKQAGSITNPVSQFSVGAALVGATALASARGTADNKDQANNTVITNGKVDTVNFLGADESFNLVSNDANIRDEIAAGLYYKDIASRNGLSVAQSNIEYQGSVASVKNVYRNKAITDIRKLVTEGYIKIARQTQDVEIVTEKAKL